MESRCPMQDIPDIPLTTTTLSLSILAGVTILMIIFNDKIDLLFKKFEPDPEKGFRKIVLLGCLVYGLMAIIMSIAVMFRIIDIAVLPK
jgi:hypothetical protein